MSFIGGIIGKVIVLGVYLSMPHFRNRFAEPHIIKLAKLWPVVGLVGLRQSGKTTLMQQLFNIDHVVTMDDLAVREEAIKSPNTFLEKLNTPVVLDEVQKAPPIFDAIKLKVDRRRIPGAFYITGSTSFSSKIGIRESLTGRIGLIELFPMSLAELHDMPFRAIKQLSEPLTSTELKPRFDVTTLSKAAMIGGMPVPAFLRDQNRETCIGVHGLTRRFCVIWRVFFREDLMRILHFRC